ncbi:MAG: hypothetical protein JXA46_07495 [Dehalococcoidales bacterium]|nr:hypothetical protein [Dehalococcoidales bacterium]
MVCLVGSLPLVSCSSEEAPSGPSVTVSSPDREYTVNLEGRVVLTIPGNTLTEGTKVAIEEIDQLRDFSFSGFAPVSLYDISTTGVDTFDKELTLEFTYDPSILDGEAEAGDQITVAYFNETYGEWQEVDYDLDELDAKLTVKTDHLSLWSMFVKEEQNITLTAPHFTIYFNKDAKAPLIGPAVSGDPIYEYATIVRTGLYDAYEAYEDLGFKLPEHTRVYIDDWGADKEAEWGWFSKNIEIPVTYIDENELHKVSAHELFHAVQNQYMSFGSMAMDRWWMEATADYAAAHIATSNGLSERLKPAYFKSGINDSETYHTYQTAHFIKFLVDSGLSFKEMFIYVMTNSGSALENLATYCKSNGKSLPELYQEFAYSAIFENTIKTENNGSAIYDELAAEKLELELGDNSALSSPASAGRNYAASVTGVKITGPASKEFEIPVRALEPTSGVDVRYILAEDQNRSSLIEYGRLDHNPVKLMVKDGNYLFFLVTNRAPSDCSVTLVIGEEFDVQPYNKKWTTKVYNDDFTVDVEFSLLSRQPFTVVQEATVRDMFGLDLQFPWSKDGIVVELECNVTNLRFTNSEDWGNRVPVFKESYWDTKDGPVNNPSMTITIPPDHPTGLVSTGYSIVIDIHNLDDDEYHYGGGATPLIIHLAVMN